MYVEKLPSGLYRITVRHNGQRKRTRAVRTVSEARLLAAELTLEMGGTPKAGKMTLDDLLDLHMVDHRYEDTTRASYLSLIEKARTLQPDLLAVRLHDVDRAAVRQLYRLLGRDLTPHRLHKFHTVLSSAFTTGLDHELVHSNPCYRAGPSVPDEPDVDPPSHDEVKLIIAKAPIRLAAVIRTAAAIGARRGELCAMQWPDITWAAGKKPPTIRIRRALAYTAAAGVIVKKPKSKRGDRTITIGAKLADVLREHRRAQATLAMQHGLGTPMWCWSNDAGVSPWRPDFLGGAYATHVATLGIDTTLHQLRHYVATSLLYDGETPATVAGILGDRVETVLKVYHHYIPGADVLAADRMDRRLG